MHEKNKISGCVVGGARITKNQMNNLHCVICDSNTIKTFSYGRLLRCMDCGFMFQTGHALTINPIEVYQKDMVKSDHIPEVWGKSRLSIFSNFLTFINRLTESKRGCLLDVGCGYGVFLNEARLDGWEVEGVEVSNQAGTYARERLQLKIYGQPLPELHLKPAQYDVITFFGVMDVIDAPLEQIDEVKKLLRPGGIVFLRVENALFHRYAYCASKMLNLSIYGITPYVFHINNFTGCSLAKFFQKAGFEEVRVLNSPLTYGDPYGGGGILGNSGVQILKIAISLAAWGVASLTSGRGLISPSLIAWAKKPL